MGAPPLRPLAAAAASPARVRSIMVSRSSWAKAAMMVEHCGAHRPVGVQTFGEAAESDPSGRQLVHHGEHVLGVASEAVEFPDGEHVTFAEMVEARFEMGPAGRSAAHAVVGVDARRPGFVEARRVGVGGSGQSVLTLAYPMMATVAPVS